MELAQNLALQYIGALCYIACEILSRVPQIMPKFSYKKKRSFKKKRRPANKYKQIKGRGRSMKLNPIQDATFVAKQRVIRFSMQHNWLLTPLTTGTGAPMHHIVYRANCPYSPFKTKDDFRVQPVWVLNSGAQADSCTNLNKFVSSADPASMELGYRSAHCLSSKINVRVIPNHNGETTTTMKQDSATVLLSTSTRDIPYGIWPENCDQISNGFNPQHLSQFAYTTRGQAYWNWNGTPKACMLSRSYSFKSMNAKSLDYSGFHNDTRPMESDFYNIIIMPNDLTQLAADSVSCGQMRVEIRIDYICKLSEPRTEIGTGSVFSEPSAISTGGTTRHAADEL